MTVGGELCVFPWIFNDTTEYSGCANPDGGTGPWCATEVINGKYIENSGNWDYCNMDLCEGKGE